MVAPLYRLGDEGPAVAEIRARLAGLGLLPDGDELRASSFDRAIFDEAVDEAVRGFQQQRGASVDGIVGPQTWRLLDDAHWRLGDRVLSYAPSHLLSGDDVLTLQQRLEGLGFDTGRTDGIFGQQTERALREFQRNVGILADGTCGPATFKALARLTRTVVGGVPSALREAEAIRRSGPRLAGKVVVLDPGHGGSDHGNAEHGLVEAELALDLASRIEGRLTATGVAAYLTRGRLGEHEAAPDDSARADTANSLGADLLVSLHVDTCPSAKATGVATYYYGHRDHGTRSMIGARFADLLQRELSARTELLDCGSHEKTWDLLRRTRMPAVRLELGYLSNPADAARLAEPGFRDVVAEAVVAAVQRLYLPPEEDAPTGSIRLPDLVGG
ncbi:MAG TPA: N-acetylmuramoyl-L-alanine amidase [Actinomycetes bacterium]